KRRNVDRAHARHGTTGGRRIRSPTRGAARVLPFMPLILLSGLFLLPSSASADISWTFNDVNSYLGSWSPTGTVYTEVATLSGSFSTNDAVTAGTEFSQTRIPPKWGHNA